MKLYLKYKSGEVTVIETDCLHLEDEEIIFYNDNREYDEELSNLDIVKLDGEVMYRDNQDEFGIKEAVKTIMELQDLFKEGINEYIKEKQND